MRVTKAVREYVEEQIQKKYDTKRSEIGLEYNAEYHALEELVEAIAKEANSRAIALVESKGFSVTSYHGSLISAYSGFKKKDIEDEINRERREWDDKARAKIRQVLFDLEIGETGKADLMKVIDGIVPD